MAARLTAFLVAAIVGVTFVAGLIVGAQRDDDGGTIDLVIYNGRVFTGDAEAPIAEAVAIRGNRISQGRHQPRDQAPEPPRDDDD